MDVALRQETMRSPPRTWLPATISTPSASVLFVCRWIVPMGEKDLSFLCHSFPVYSAFVFLLGTDHGHVNRHFGRNAIACVVSDVFLDFGAEVSIYRSILRPMPSLRAVSLQRETRESRPRKFLTFVNPHKRMDVSLQNTQRVRRRR